MDFDDLEDLEGDRVSEDRAAAEKEAAEKAAADKAAAKAESAAADKEDAEKAAKEKAAKEKSAAEPAPAAKKEPPAKKEKLAGPRWEIVGGADKGGILVKEGESTSSTQMADRLSTGAVVLEVELKGDRLNYKLIEGTGPAEGWVSVKLPGKDLAVKIVELEDAEPFDLAEFIEKRCAEALAQPPVKWRQVGMEALEKENQKAKGSFYGLEFPWNMETLGKMGAAWLDKAFHAAGSIPKDIHVTKLKNIKEYIGGGNCGKMIFDVEYNKNCDQLHTKLFAKIPFPLTPKTRSDRMASSIMQQGAELGEINAHRLWESRLNFPIPRYYFGDSSNETTNWILITQRIAFDQQEGDRHYDPPYEKGRDWELKGTFDEYYFLLMKIGGQMTGRAKAGKMAPQEVLDKIYDNPAYNPPQGWGMGPHNTGLPDAEFKAKIKMGGDFICDIAKALFPASIANPDWINNTWKKALATVNVYKQELAYWAHRNPDYITWTHGNLNVDNVFFWRDPDNKLDLGVLDWGGAGISSMGPRLWWWLYGAEYDFLNDNIDKLLEYYIKEYKANGGPQLELEELKTQFVFAALDQGVGLLGAVPQIYRMCSKKEWPTIKDRKDPRIANNVDGKNTLRIYVLTFISVARIIAEWDVPAMIEKWVKDFHEAIPQIPKKSTAGCLA